MHEIAEMRLKGNIEGVSLEEYWLNKKIENVSKKNFSHSRIIR